MDTSTKLNLSSYIKPAEGYVHVYKRFPDRVEQVDEGYNLVVQSGKQIILKSLFPESSSDYLNYGKIGVGGAVDTAGTILKVPSSDVTDLYDPVAVIPITKLSEDMTVPSITMLASVDNMVANGRKINEVGFFSGAGLMFSIKTFATVTKDRSFSLDFVWTFKIV